MQRGCQPVNDSLRRIAPVRTVDILLTVALVCVIFGAGCGHIFGAVGSTNPGACSVPRMDEHFDGPLPPNAYEPQPPLEGCAQSGYDVIVVLGCPTNRDGTPSACQKRRISLALELRALGFAAPVLVSGGAAKTEHVEAEAMAGLLRESGVPEDQIVQEPRALHTDENIALASAAMRARGWVTALVVSDDAGHFLFAALCDANCCVREGRMTLFGKRLPGDILPVTLGHYVLYPSAPRVSPEECAAIGSPTKGMCALLPTRRSCSH